ncbi:TAP-like protein [Streptomyces sp. TverLS-915]|uniref:alpha/beta hydrolase n=1 Tax=Streptomyces sp. TverLS-915 TaxID=1839763 RepID=UPI00081F5B6F|nr:alpha/beta hydrolase [Streptomyces sp. TverLS-915]SCE00098.1 TAP-like protein [Streptomyces sp. TverLS-915]
MTTPRKARRPGRSRGSAPHPALRSPEGLLVPALALALALTALPAAAHASPSSPALTWSPCGSARQECATLTVPLDYSRPHGRTVHLAVSRIRAEGARRGTLAVVPGGPGSSGVRRLADKGAALMAATGGRYDLVSFDPRGVGGSTTAACGLPEEDRRLATVRSWPGAGGGIAENVARSRRTAEACGKNGGAVLASFTTANEVRDLDRLRAALGSARLSVWATSYGTYVAAGYAQKHPGRTARVVLDSSGDPDPARVERGWLANMARGAEDRFPDFAAWAADPARGTERLAERPARVRTRVLGLARELDAHPRATTTPGLALTGGMLLQALQTALYDDAAFPEFAGLVRAADATTAGPVVLPPSLAQPMSQQDAAVTISVICNDVDWPGSVADHARGVAEDRARYPLTGGMPVNITPCSYWKNEPAEPPARVTDEGPSNILMVQNLRDPATPYAGALRMRAALGRKARLVSVDSGGHGSYLGTGNACGDAAVTAFFVDGVRPDRDIECP